MLLLYLLVLRVMGEGQKKEDKVAIILANFGTTVPSGVESILNIQKKIQNAFPGVPVKLTFTSNMIRGVWKERQAEAKNGLMKVFPKKFST